MRSMSTESQVMLIYSACQLHLAFVAALVVESMKRPWSLFTALRGSNCMIYWSEPRRCMTVLAAEDEREHIRDGSYVATEI